ncbi:unnamed protein product [Schistosoma turkestanicum]|nr:unnamed protein product [Schistosoma turkestanicum]
MGLPYGPFAGEVDSPNEQSIRNIIHCNTLSTALMTSLVLSKMLTQKELNPGIINISSYAGLKIFPYATMYAATKAFTLQFSKCLAAENYKKQITIQTVCPLSISTSMTNFPKTTFFIPTAKQYVKNALDMYGVESQTYGYSRHELKAYLYNLLPASVWLQMMKSRGDATRKNP